MSTKALIRIIGITLVLASFFWITEASATSSLTATARSYGTGYSQTNFIVSADSSASDSAVKKIILFYGTTLANMIRKDSLTSSITYPDTIAKAVGTFRDGTTYYWYVSVQDSTTTIYFPPDYKTAPLQFTTTAFTQNLTITTGYSTALIIHDSVGYYVAPLDSLVLHYGTVSGTYTVADTITSVTHPDSFALTGLMEGGTYYCMTVAFMADSGIVDTSAEFSFSTTDLSSSTSILRSNIDSLILKIDSVDFCPDSFIIQYGNSALQLTQDSAVAETVTTVTCPDTIIITGIIEGEQVFWQVLFFLPDSSAIDTGAVGSYTRPHNRFWENFYTANFWPPTITHKYLWEFTGAGSDYSTGPIPITTPWIRIHGGMDGADDLSPGDSIAGYIWSWDNGDSTVIDTVMAQDADTATITPISYMFYPDMLSDSGLTYYPLYNWGTHYSISFDCVDTTIYEDSTIGKRTVAVFIEEIK